MKVATADQALAISYIFSKASSHALRRLLEEGEGLLLDLIEAAEKRPGDKYLAETSRWSFRESMRLPRYPSPRIFEVSVDVDPMVAPAIMLEKGDYGYVPEGLREAVINGTLNRSRNQGRVKISVLHFDRNLAAHGESGLTIEEEMEAINNLPVAPRYRPLTIDEVLALGAQKPELQKKFPMVAYGLFREYKDHHDYDRRTNIALDKNPANKPNTRRLSEYELSQSCCYSFYRILAVEVRHNNQ
jgi:hypothetical protein